jgi:hypothetical protein
MGYKSREDFLKVLFRGIQWTVLLYGG